jgi:hypothetical protein
LHKTPFIRTVKYQLPWQHWTVDDFLSQQCLDELKSVPVKVQQQVPGRRVGSERLFITDDNQGSYPHLHDLWKSLHQGAVRDYFEYHTGQDYKNLFPRVEVLSDWGDFYLSPHHDHLEKRLTAMVYTDHEKLYPGTELVDGYRVESKNNRCFFFVPNVDTIHGYPATHFESVRRCLQINYWTYSA